VLFIGAGEMIELCATHFAAQAPARLTSPTARSSARRARAPLRRPPRSSSPRCRAPARARHRRVLHRLVAADPRQGAGRARAARAPAPADVHGGPRRAARHRARGRGARRRVPLHHRRPRQDRAGQPRPPRRGRAGRGHHRARRSASSCTGWPRAPSVPLIRSCAPGRAAARRQELERAQRMLRAATIRAEVLEALSQGLTNKLLHGPDPGAERGRRRASGARSCALIWSACTRPVNGVAARALERKLASLGAPRGARPAARAPRRADMEQFRKLSREHAEIAPWSRLYERYRKAEATPRPPRRWRATRRCAASPRRS
jgi:hypothetical protein